MANKILIEEKRILLEDGSSCHVARSTGHTDIPVEDLIEMWRLGMEHVRKTRTMKPFVVVLPPKKPLSPRQSPHK